MRRRKSALIKSNNRHLAGGQKYIVELNVMFPSQLFLHLRGGPSPPCE